MRRQTLIRFISVVVLVIVFVVAIGGSVITDRLYGFKPLDFIVPRSGSSVSGTKVVTEQSLVIDVVKKVSPSVVTVSAQIPQQNTFNFGPFGMMQPNSPSNNAPQDIGTGFIVSSDGLIVTNKHVVSTVQGATYQVITSDGKIYPVQNINRDPANDIAILKINATGLKPVELGDSTNLQVGQYVVAIGTALGQFRNTVTQGVVSGLGRGITAGDSLQGYVEQLDNVIQTDAAINPGNSGGPLLNSSGQVIGINVAVAQGANNIGFAIPVNTVKASLTQFQTTGKFVGKPYLGVEYQMITQQSALLNSVPQGAYVVNVVAGSPAEKAGVQTNDIITKIDGQSVTGANTDFSKIIAGKKIGDSVKLDIYRNGQTVYVSATLSESPTQ